MLDARHRRYFDSGSLLQRGYSLDPNSQWMLFKKEEKGRLTTTKHRDVFLEKEKRHVRGNDEGKFYFIESGRHREDSKGNDVGQGISIVEHKLKKIELPRHEMDSSKWFLERKSR